MTRDRPKDLWDMTVNLSNKKPGDFKRIADFFSRWLKSCVLCPRGCRVNRLSGERGFCHAAGQTALVNSAHLHHGEEPPISGNRGSGTVFFSGCTMSCCFCQNHEISQYPRGEELDPQDLAAVFLQLKLKGAHNLNLVTPTPHLVVIMKALAIAGENGFDLPVVYNTSGYERASVIRRLNGLIDVYMPDYKYFSPIAAARLSNAPDYVRHCRESIAEMFRQVGPLELDENGVAQKGVLVRHLVLPAGWSNSGDVLRDLARISAKKGWVSLMAQYHPCYEAHTIPGLNRQLSLSEFSEAREALLLSGIENGYAQWITGKNGEHLPALELHRKPDENQS